MKKKARRYEIINYHIHNHNPKIMETYMVHPDEMIMST